MRRCLRGEFDGDAGLETPPFNRGEFKFHTDLLCRRLFGELTAAGDLLENDMSMLVIDETCRQVLSVEICVMMLSSRIKHEQRFQK